MSKDSSLCFPGCYKGLEKSPCRRLSPQPCLLIPAFLRHCPGHTDLLISSVLSWAPCHQATRPAAASLVPTGLQLQPYKGGRGAGLAGSCAGCFTAPRPWGAVPLPWPSPWPWWHASPLRRGRYKGWVVMGTCWHPTRSQRLLLGLQCSAQSWGWSAGAGGTSTMQWRGWEGGAAPARMLVTVGIRPETGKQSHAPAKTHFPPSMQAMQSTLCFSMGQTRSPVGGSSKQPRAAVGLKAISATSAMFAPRQRCRWHQLHTGSVVCPPVLQASLGRARVVGQEEDAPPGWPGTPSHSAGLAVPPLRVMAERHWLPDGRVRPQQGRQILRFLPAGACRRQR